MNESLWKKSAVADIIIELGEVLEYRTYEDRGLKQTSYCYLAKQVGEQQESALEENELEQGMIGMRANNIDHAIKLLQSDKPNNKEGKFIQKRDLAILKAAKAQL
ncbi:MAG: hypothetical protein ABI354_00595 [Candidatus Saccharimonadales bacterium]